MRLAKGLDALKQNWVTDPTMFSIALDEPSQLNLKMQVLKEQLLLD